MELLEKYSKDLLLPVNIKKTKMILVCNAVAPSYPNVFFEKERVEIASSFKYLGVEIRTKIRNIYSALRKMHRTIPPEQRCPWRQRQIFQDYHRGAARQR